MKAGVGGAGAGKGGKALVKPVLTVETDAKKVREKKNKFYCYRIIRSSLISDRYPPQILSTFVVY